jgi:hypothetical protein
VGRGDYSDRHKRMKKPIIQNDIILLKKGKWKDYGKLFAVNSGIK